MRPPHLPFLYPDNILKIFLPGFFEHNIFIIFPDTKCSGVKMHHPCEDSIIAQNGDPKKEEIALAQSYFAKQKPSDLLKISYFRRVFLWSSRPGSNRRPARYECAALPTEPRKHMPHQLTRHIHMECRKLFDTT